MSKCNTCWLLAAFCISISSHAQNLQKTDLGIKTVINSTAVEIQFYAPSTVRIVKSPSGRSYTKESLSVIKQPQKTTINIKQQGDLLNLTSEKLRIVLNVKSGDLAYYTKVGNLLLKEKEGSTKFTAFND